MATCTVFSTDTTEVKVERDGPTRIIGERINPTNRKKLAAALREGDLSLVAAEAKSQVEQGADLLDVNVGTSGVDEVELLPRAVRTVIEETGRPVSIDASNWKAIARALETCSGKHLVNSTTGEDERLAQLLPVVAEHEASVIGLCMDESGIPKTVDARLKIADKIINRAVAAGIPEENVLIDPLVLSVGSDSQAARITLETAKRVRDEFGVNMTMGGSNVSFGLPRRGSINVLFLAMAIWCGVNAPIVNPGAAGVVGATRIADLLKGNDNYAMRFIKYHRSQEKK